MHRSVIVPALVAGLVVASCSSAAAPTPQIVYLTPEPTPQIVYVTPEPTAASPTATPTPPAITVVRTHILATLTALQEQADAITSASDLGDVEATYEAIQAVNRLVTDELDWLNTQPASVTDVPVILLYKARLLAYQPLGRLTLTHFYDGTEVDTAREAGSAMADVLLLRPDISVIEVTP